MTMRIATYDVLSVLTPDRNRSTGRPSLLTRLNRYTLWAFNPQRELTTRYDRAA
jgi:hypothetical protein